jgi:RNA polymerase sigma-70 factor (ECF subfamily)
MARTYDARRGFAPQWLYRSVRNRAIDHVRRRTREAARIAASSERSEAMLAGASSNAPTPAEEAEAGEFLEVIGRLDARYAHLVRLAFVDGWSHSAIAGLTGLPLGTVKTRIRLSLKLIRGLLSEADITPDVGEDDSVLGLTDARVLLVGGTDAFALAVRRAAVGLARVERASCLPSEPREAPAAVIVASDEPAEQSVARVRELGWRHVPMAVVSRGEASASPLEHDAPVIVTRIGRKGLTPAILVPAVLSATRLPRLQRTAARRLLGRSGAAAITADRLGRVTKVSSAAARLLGRTPRQLIGAYVTELAAMPKSSSEHEFHRLVSRGWWSGDGAVRPAAGGVTAVRATAWLVEGGGLVSILNAVTSGPGAGTTLVRG